jgi:hypothetical protein
MLPSASRPAVLVLAVALGAAGCGSKSSSPGPSSAGSTAAKAPAGTAKRSAKEQTVPIKVVKKGDGSTVAVVPVFVGKRGPFPFVLDTGASQSVLDAGLVHKLGIPLQGKEPGISSVTGNADAAKVGIKNWRAGKVALPAQAVISVSTPTGKEIKRSSGNDVTFGGLLGSDILSTFGIVAIDYKRSVLILHAPR